MLADPTWLVLAADGLVPAAYGLVPAADWIGRHALAVFALLLLLLPAAVAAVLAWAPAGALPPRVVAVWLLTGIVLGTAVVAALAAQLAPGSALRQADQALMHALQVTMSPGVLPLFAAVTHLADAATRTVLGAVVALALLARQQPALAAGWVLALAGNGLVTYGLKQFFGRPRPLAQAGFGLETGFSFPSGHSAGAVVAYGMLAYLACRLLPPRWHRPAWVAAVALALAVGASRVFLGVHFASDVLAGFASGLVWLLLCIGGLLRWQAWRDHRG